MQYHLDTIPVWEAMEADGSCPLCALREKCERQETERSLGGSVMEPDVRVQVNDRGFCLRHHQQLFLMQNRLGHALLTDSHAKEQLKKLEKLNDGFARKPASKRGLFGGGRDLEPLAAGLEALASGCVICDAVERHMARYRYTLLHLWKSDAAFREKWEASEGVCVPHAAELVRQAQKQLSAARGQAFAASVTALLSRSLAGDEKDLEWFTLKFDYRNHDKPWGNSKNALERTISRLRGRLAEGGDAARPSGS